jgi:hypothetical protein
LCVILFVTSMTGCFLKMVDLNDENNR